MPDQNIKRFQESITKELTLIKDRVRDLIGNSNWGEEGRYKEAILRKIILQFLPSNLNIGTGFILSNSDFLHGTNSLKSKQFDIIIYDSKTPLIFQEGDFIITTETAVRAVIEVKTKITNYSSEGKKSLNNIIEILETLKQFETFDLNRNIKKRFIGIFSYEYDQDFMNSRIEDTLKFSSGIVNYISLGPDKFIRYCENATDIDPDLMYAGPCYIRYNLSHLSFSYFISNLLHIVSDEDPIERYWFSFPIEGTKEIYRQDPIIKVQNAFS